MFLLVLSGCEKKKNEDEKSKSYVELNEINVTSAQNIFKVSFKPYARDKEKNPINVEGVTFNTAVGTYRFYDLNESLVDENGYITYSYKYDAVVPIKYNVSKSDKGHNKEWARSYAFLQANVFDYYTGELYKEKNVASSNVHYNDLDKKENLDIAYTNITWEDKIYTIGVRNEVSSKWEGIKKVESHEYTNTYTDTNRVTVTTYVYAPKDFDGLMISLNKNGTTKELVINQKNENNRINELMKANENKTEKDEEYIKMEEELNHLYKLLDKQYYYLTEPKKEDYYVFRLKDITKIK